MAEYRQEQEFAVGMHVANALEAIKGEVEEGYQVFNWDNDLNYNRYKGMDPKGMVDEFVGSGATETHLGLLNEGIRNSYPEEEKRPQYVKEVLDSIEEKLNPGE